jgi:hypothetical protein
MSCYVHNVPGRLRVRTTKLKYSIDYASVLCQELEQIEGVKKIEYNPKAGSLIIFYDVQILSSEDILYQLHKTELLKNCPVSTNHHSANYVGTILGSALFGTLMKKSIETSVSSLTKIIR